MPSYNLLDEGWIPCLRAATKPPELLSIRQTLHQAHSIHQVSDPSPAVTIMLYRVLLAILHRALDGPRTTEEWAVIWRAGQWNMRRIDAYLDRLHDRFDLFDATHPFYQTPGLDDGAFKDVNQLALERASNRNRPLLFDHSVPGSGMAPDTAARYVLAQQGFSVGGMFSTNPGDDPAAKYASASPLLKCAVCLATGKTLFETLMLNWQRYNYVAGSPYPFFNDDDKPTWERDDPVLPIERQPCGWVDLLTWQCRRIALRPAVPANRSVWVTHAAIMQGFRLPTSFELPAAEAMVAFTEVTPKVTATKQSGRSFWAPVGLSLGKASWRDSHALLQSMASNRRPRILDWLSQLTTDHMLQAPAVIPLAIFGVIADQARIVDWRYQTLPLPRQFIETPQIMDVVRRALEFAEHMSQLLESRILYVPNPGHDDTDTLKGPSPVRVLAEELLRFTSDVRADPSAIDALGEHLSPIESFWAALDVPFRAFLSMVARARNVHSTSAAIPAIQDATAALNAPDRVDQRAHVVDTLDASAQHEEGEQSSAERMWIEEVNRVARTCFNEAARNLGDSGRFYRAVALATRRLTWCMYRLNAMHNAAHDAAHDALPFDGQEAPSV